MSEQGGATGVRIEGEVVHRRTGPWTPAVHDLLVHVRAEGIVEAPEVLGREGDEEQLGFIAGDPPTVPLREAQLVSIGRLLRRLRSALATFPDVDGRTWRQAAVAGGPLAHGDVAWWNLVFIGDEVVGLLDWDLAAPTIESYDLAYALWTCVPLEPDLPLDDALRRSRSLVDAYGATDDERAHLVETIAFAQARVAWVIANGWATDDLGLGWIWDEGRRLGRMARSMLWLAEHRDALTEALTL